MRIYWVNCVGGRYHLMGRCPKCDKGVLFVTSSTQVSEVITTDCPDCRASLGLYVQPQEHKAWALAEPAEVVMRD